MAKSPLQPHGSSASDERVREVPGGAFSLLGESREQSGVECSVLTTGFHGELEEGFL